MTPIIEKTFHFDRLRYTIRHYGKPAEKELSFEESIRELDTRFSEAKLRSLNQVHGSDFIDFRKDLPSDNGISWEPAADAAVSSSVPILIRTADCVPILFWSTETVLFGGIHAGWRGLDQKILTKVLHYLEEQVNLSKLMFWVGPHIQPNSYETGPDVYERFPHECSIPSGNADRKLLNLNCVLYHEFQQAGIESHQVMFERDDTLTSPLLYSHRGKDDGRNISMITAGAMSF